MPINDSLGDRMKFFERYCTGVRLMPILPVIARLDGVAFHTFTRGLKRPYDERLSRMMIESTRYLAKLTNANVGYTQSDEITLVWTPGKFEDKIYFDSKLFKMISVLASRCSVYFNSLLEKEIPEKVAEQPVFDCRVWNVPNLDEAANSILWRERDAARNSVSMAAQSMYSHSELQNKSSAQMQEMMFQKGQNWNDYPAFFKRGTCIQKRVSQRPFSVDEMANLPQHHAARRNPDLQVSRTDFVEIELPSLGKVTNRVDVLFRNAQPILK